MLYKSKNRQEQQEYDPVVENQYDEVTCSKLQKFGWIFLIIITIGLIYTYKIKKINDINRLQVKINGHASNIDVQLQKRFDTLTKLVSAVKKHVSFNKEIYENITMYRAKANQNNNNEKEQIIDKISDEINIVFENYPELGADASITKLMNESTMIEKEIAASGRLYNAEVTKFNSIIYNFPTNVMIANKEYLGVPLFVAKKSVKQDVYVEI